MARSKVSREVIIVGIHLRAPFSGYRLGPGDFTALVRDPGGKMRPVKFTIKVDKTTKVDLDKR